MYECDLRVCTVFCPAVLQSEVQSVVMPQDTDPYFRVEPQGDLGSADLLFANHTTAGQSCVSKFVL